MGGPASGPPIGSRVDGRHEVIDRVRFPDGTGFDVSWIFHVG
jgi:hypothetical protein